jgi:hypothetical protein
MKWKVWVRLRGSHDSKNKINPRNYSGSRNCGDTKTLTLNCVIKMFAFLRKGPEIASDTFLVFLSPSRKMWEYLRIRLWPLSFQIVPNSLFSIRRNTGYYIMLAVENVVKKDKHVVIS